MATITGSTTIDWSSISLAQVDFETHYVNFANRVDQIENEFNSGNFSPVSSSSTLIVVDLFIGGRLSIGGSGFTGTSPLKINFATYKNPSNGTGEVLSFTGTLSGDGIDNDVLTSVTIGSTGFSETFKGNINIPETFPDPPGNYTATLTSLVVKIGSATATFSGNLNLTGDQASASLTGTVTGISVVSGTNTIKMTGLSVDVDVLEAALASNALATVNDLFSVIGNLQSGNDTITYTNNSSAGMTFAGGAGDDTITIGGLRNDTLNGGDGNDILIGGLGQDIVNGGTGDDRITMLVTANNVDTIDAGVDTDTLVLSGVVPGNHVVVVDLSATDQVVSIGGTPDNTLIQKNFENLNASGIGSSVNVTGSAGDNSIIGSNGNDIIDGGDGNDTLIGGLGNDTYTVDSAADVVTEALNAGTDKVFSSIDYTLTANVENLELAGIADLNATGNALANVLTGNSGVNILTGGAGNDTYIVQNDADSVVENLNAGIDLVQSSAASFTLGANIENLTLVGSTDLNGTGNILNNIITGNSGHNTLSGDAGNDQLIGGVGNDHLDGGAGTDKMAGGLGDDTYVVDVATDVVTEALNAGTDRVFASLNYRLGANLENLTLTGTGNINGTGNAFANTLTGNSGNNTLSGLAGNDQLDGGDGNDLLLGGLGTDTVTGGAGDDQITMLVTANNVDTIDAGADTDTLVLSGVVPGNHVVVVDLSATDQVVSIGGTPDNTLIQKNFENLNASGIGSSVNVTGSAGDNSIIGSNGNDSINGGAGNDILNGGVGADIMSGGLGNDTYVVDNVGDIVTENSGEGTADLVQSAVSFTLGANIENLTLTGAGAINATGNELNNILTGNGAANVLDGKGGADQMAGGGGNDTYVVDSLGDTVTELLAGVAGGTDLVKSAVDFTLGDNVEKLTLTGSAGITGTGNAGNNVLIGNAGNNVLDGKAGSDKMAGGLGDDTYVVDMATDVVTEALNAGTDRVFASLNYRLGANVENLELTGSANLNGTGNALANIITGNSGNNTLSGLAGNDQLDGGDGNDTYVIGLGTDVLTENLNEGTDTVQSSITHTLGDNFENLTLTGVGAINGTGNELANVLTGNAAANVLNGGAGDDTLLGGLGNDTLRGGLGNDTVNGGSGNDTFLFGLGDGQDLVQDNSGSADKMLFDGGINPLDLVISRQANDLRLAIHGSSDQITVQNWYVGTTNRTETIQAGNGQVLLNTQVQQLIDAMAQFTTDTGLSWDAASGGAGNPGQQAQFQSILAASWQ
jgi:Ca2+-binding RTX toxin-like protein